MSLANYDEPADRGVLRMALEMAAALPDGHRIAALEKVLAGGDPEGAARAYADRLYSGSKLADRQFVSAALAKSTKELEALGDPFIDLAAALYPELKAQSRRSDEWNGRLDELYGRRLDVEAAFMARDFIPDANGTLRMTFGRVKGYSPADAVYYRPFTTLDGVLEKTTGRPPFDTPGKLFELRRAEDFGRFRPPGFASVPACVLYDADTTGGNSGSPVLNARGELVAVNFDRTFEATINDYAWSPDYSRSIGVDIRYVLWVTEKFGGAGFLLAEMGVR